MNLRLASFLGGVALLSACGAPVLKSAVPLLKSAVPMIAAVAGASAQPSTPTTAPLPDAPQVWVTLRSRGVKFPMAEIANHDGVKIFASTDGAQVFLKNDILVGTRGFGRDLMSADATSMADLKPETQQNRIFYDLDGTDTTIRHSNICTGEVPTPSEDTPTFSQACASDIGTVHNEFWLDARKNVVKSKQWVSQGVGYAIIEPKTD